MAMNGLNGKLNAAQLSHLNLHPRFLSNSKSDGNSIIKESKLSRNLKSTSMIMLDIKSTCSNGNSNTGNHNGSSGGSGASGSPRSSSSSSFEEELELDSQDSNEELEYGPGIVAKLTNKFLKYSLKTNTNNSAITTTESGLMRRSQFRSHNNLTHYSSLENLLNSNNASCNNNNVLDQHLDAASVSNSTFSSGEDDATHPLRQQLQHIQRNHKVHHHQNHHLLRVSPHHQEQQQHPIASTWTTSSNMTSKNFSNSSSSNNHSFPYRLLSKNNKQSCIIHHLKDCNDDAGDEKAAIKNPEVHDPVLHLEDDNEVDGAETDVAHNYDVDQDDYDSVDMVLDETACSSSFQEHEVCHDDDQVGEELFCKFSQTGNQEESTQTSISYLHGFNQSLDLNSKDVNTISMSSGKQGVSLLDSMSYSMKSATSKLEKTTPVIRNLHVKSSTQPLLLSSSSTFSSATSTSSSLTSTVSSRTTTINTDTDSNHNKGVSQQSHSHVVPEKDNTGGEDIKSYSFTKKSSLDEQSHPKLGVTDTTSSNSSHKILSPVTSKERFLKTLTSSSNNTTIATPRSHQYHVGPLSSLTPVVKKSHSMDNVLLDGSPTRAPITNTTMKRPLPPPPLLPVTLASNRPSMPPPDKPPVLPSKRVDSLKNPVISKEGNDCRDSTRGKDDNSLILPTPSPRVTAVVNPMKKLNDVSANVSPVNLLPVVSSQRTTSLPVLPSMPFRNLRVREHHQQQPTGPPSLPPPLPPPSVPPPLPSSLLPPSSSADSYRVESFPPKVPLRQNRSSKSSLSSSPPSIATVVSNLSATATQTNGNQLLDKEDTSSLFSNSLPSPLSSCNSAAASTQSSSLATTITSNLSSTDSLLINANANKISLRRGSTLPTVKPVIAQKPKVILKVSPFDQQKQQEDTVTVLPESATDQSYPEKSLASTSASQIPRETKSLKVRLPSSSSLHTVESHMTDPSSEDLISSVTESSSDIGSNNDDNSSSKTEKEHDHRQETPSSLELNSESSGFTITQNNSTPAGNQQLVSPVTDVEESNVAAADWIQKDTNTSKTITQDVCQESTDVTLLQFKESHSKAGLAEPSSSSSLTTGDLSDIPSTTSIITTKSTISSTTRFGSLQSSLKKSCPTFSTSFSDFVSQLTSDSQTHNSPTIMSNMTHDDGKDNECNRLNSSETQQLHQSQQKSIKKESTVESTKKEGKERNDINFRIKNQMEKSSENERIGIKIQGMGSRKQPPNNNITNSMVFDFRGKNVQPSLAIKSPYGRSPVISSNDEPDAPEDYRGSTEIPEASGIEFVGENQVINDGILLKRRNKKLSISFSPEEQLTETFEYPSESCLLKYFKEEQLEQQQENSKRLPENNSSCSLFKIQAPIALNNLKNGVMRNELGFVVTKPLVSNSYVISECQDSLNHDVVLIKPADSSQTTSWSTSSSASDILF